MSLGPGALCARSKSGVLSSTASVCVLECDRWGKYSPPGGLWRGMNSSEKQRLLSHPAAVPQLLPHRQGLHRPPCSHRPRERHIPRKIWRFVVTATSLASRLCGTPVRQGDSWSKGPGHAKVPSTSSTSALADPRGESVAIS